MKKELGPYFDTLDKLADSNLNYIRAKHGVKLGLDQPITVAKARQTLLKTEKKAEKLDPKIVKHFIGGAYSKRIDKYLDKK